VKEGSLRAPLFLYTYYMQRDYMNKGYHIPAGQPGSTADLPVNPTEPATNNFLASNFFKFTLPRVSTVTYFVQSVSMPGTQLSPVEMTNTLGRANQFVGGRFDHEPLVVQFIVDEETLNYQEIFDWMKKIANYENDTNIIAGEQKDKFFTDANLFLTNSAFKEKRVVVFKNAYPIALSGMQFASTLNDNEPIIASVTLNFESYSFETVT